MIKPWFGQQRATKEKKKDELCKTGNYSVKWVLNLPEPCIHKRTHTYTLTHSLTHCCTTTRDTVAAFSKGKDKYNTVSGSSVRYANTQSSSRMRYTHTAKHFEWSHTAGRRFSLPRGPGFSPAWFGQPSMEEEVRLRNEGRRTASSRQQPSSCGYWI